MESNYLYKISPSLLNSLRDYLESDDVWEKYWGRSFDPSKTRQQFKDEKAKDLLNSINGVKTRSRAADKGTAFNNLVDLLYNKITIEESGLTIEENSKFFFVKFNGEEFTFIKEQVYEVASKYQNFKSQIYVNTILETVYGNVMLHGYIDEFKPDDPTVYDIKTTKKYEQDKFWSNFQHSLYIYCLRKEGYKVDKFIYDVYVMNEPGYIIGHHTEEYNFKENIDSEIISLRFYCEQLIEFIKQNRDKITNKKFIKNKL